MKKVGLLILALVMALGALGVGYAYWTQPVTIYANVDMGNLEATIDSSAVLAGNAINGAGLTAAVDNSDPVWRRGVGSYCHQHLSWLDWPCELHRQEYRHHAYLPHAPDVRDCSGDTWVSRRGDCKPC